MNYEDFFCEEDVAVYKRVKRGTMELGRTAREVAAEMVDGRIGVGKEFVRTRRGVYRLAMSDNSDNSTERTAHDGMGAAAVVMGDDGDLDDFFRQHGVEGGLARFKSEVRRRLDAQLRLE